MISYSDSKTTPQFSSVLRLCYIKVSVYKMFMEYT